MTMQVIRYSTNRTDGMPMPQIEDNLFKFLSGRIVQIENFKRKKIIIKRFMQSAILADMGVAHGGGWEKHLWTVPRTDMRMHPNDKGFTSKRKAQSSVFARDTPLYH